MSKRSSSYEPRKIGNAECVWWACYDTGNAVLEYGHDPRPQLWIATKRLHEAQETFEESQKVSADMIGHQGCCPGVRSKPTTTAST